MLPHGSVNSYQGAIDKTACEERSPIEKLSLFLQQAGTGGVGIHCKGCISSLAVEEEEAEESYRRERAAARLLASSTSSLHTYLVEPRQGGIRTFARASMRGRFSVLVEARLLRHFSMLRDVSSSSITSPHFVQALHRKALLRQMNPTLSTWTTALEKVRCFRRFTDGRQNCRRESLQTGGEGWLALDIADREGLNLTS